MTDTLLDLSSGRITVIEDDLEVRRSLTLMLRARGYTVDVYRHGGELLSVRGRVASDCLLIDYWLPGLDGLGLLTRLRQVGHTAPAILITGVIATNLERKAIEAGFEKILTKPLQTGALIDSINLLVS